jgi:hypothetical protein
MLQLDLSGGADANLHAIIWKAKQLLAGEELANFNAESERAIAPGAGQDYPTVLALINSYVRLVDSSGTYPEYAERAATEGR